MGGIIMSCDNKGNLSLWNTAPVVIGEFIVGRWKPAFEKSEIIGSVYFSICDEQTLLGLCPYECSFDLSLLFSRAKEKMFAEVGFDLDSYFGSVLDVFTLSKMESDLLKKIDLYESSRGVSVREMFLQMVLFSEWKMPYVSAIEFIL